jgi:hypothetical protein
MFMIRWACLVSILLVGAFAAFAQNLAETSLAAATGSVAGVAGKPISDSLGKIFGQVNAQAKSSASPQPRKSAPATREVPAKKPGVSTTAPMAGAFSAGSGSRSAPARGGSSRSRARMHYAAPLPAPLPAPEPPVAAAPPTLEQIASVGTGTERADVLTRLGSPVARVSIPESGQLLEVYQYVDRRGNLGSVRLRDGRVSEVRVDSQIN